MPTRSLLDRWIYKSVREIVAPISKQGVDAEVIESKGWGGHDSATDFKGRRRPEPFTPSTVIINGGFAMWEFEIPEEIRKNLVDMTLKIETVRAHGMLHTPHQGRTASIFFNQQLIDKISLVKPHPHGSDYGVDSRRAIPVLPYCNTKGDAQILRIETDDEVFWDIDRVTLEPVVLRKEVTPGAAMVLGALISAALGGIVSYLTLFLSSKK